MLRQGVTMPGIDDEGTHAAPDRVITIRRATSRTTMPARFWYSASRRRPLHRRAQHRHRRRRGNPRALKLITDPHDRRDHHHGDTGHRARCPPEAIDPLFEEHRRLSRCCWCKLPEDRHLGHPVARDRASPAPPTSSACWARPAPARRLGRDSVHELDTARAPTIPSRSCRDFIEGCGGRRRRARRCRAAVRQHRADARAMAAG